jgi:hypothetical protein
VRKRERGWKKLAVEKKTKRTLSRRHTLSFSFFGWNLKNHFHTNERRKALSQKKTAAQGEGRGKGTRKRGFSLFLSSTTTWPPRRPAPRPA